MKLICIDNSGICPLKKGKIYDGEYVDWGSKTERFTIPIMGKFNYFYTWRFQPIVSINCNIKIL